MGHDATKVVLGSTRSSSKEGTEVFASNPATYKAGLAVRRASTGLLSVAVAAGKWAGVSLGKSLSNHNKTVVLKSGEQVPILVSRTPARGEVAITDYAALLTTNPDTITIGATVFTAQSGAATPGDATFRAATSNAATATSLVTQINAHVTAGALVVASIDPADTANVIITAKSNLAAGDTIALEYEDVGTGGIGATVSGATLEDSEDDADFVSLGAPVYISDDTGMADDPNSAATISNAIYASGILTGIGEDGVEVACAIIDMPGGL